jgi:hypothetical protein
MLSSFDGGRMLRRAAFSAFAVIGLVAPAVAGVLSSADVQRIEDYDRFVRPAAQEAPILRDMKVRVGRLITAAKGSDAAFDPRAALRNLPRTGGEDLERMVSALQAIDGPAALAPPEWAALLAEVDAEIEARLAYDADVMRAYQRSVAAGTPGFGGSVVGWDDRPGAGHRWSRFQEILDRTP